MTDEATRTAVAAELLRLAADVMAGEADRGDAGSFVQYRRQVAPPDSMLPVSITASVPMLPARPAIQYDPADYGYAPRVCSECGSPEPAGHTVGCPQLDIPA